MNEKLNDLQQDAKQMAHEIWLAGLGAMTMAGEEGSKFYKALLEKGAAFEKAEKPPIEAVKNAYERTVEATTSMFSRIEDAIKDKTVAVLQKMDIPTREELSELNARVEALTQAIERLTEKK